MYPSRDLREQALNAVAMETGRAGDWRRKRRAERSTAIVALAMCVHTCIEERGISRTTALPIYPGGGSTPPDQSWRLPHFGQARRRRTLLDGLLDAPRPPHTSQAMLDARAEDQARIAEQQRRDREHAKHVVKLQADEAAREQQQREAEVKRVLAAMPPERRAKAQKRFNLPKELAND